MFKTIAFFTSCRGDIGILSPLIKKIYETKELKALLFVGGTHLSKKYGFTINEIKKEGLIITNTYDYLAASDRSYNLSVSTNKSGVQTAKFFRDYNFDYVCILGDRYERIPIILNAIIFKTPIIHLHGGEITQGLIDEQVRHLISKAAHLHFVVCEQYKKNLLSLGEDTKRIFNTGSLAIDNIKKTQKIDWKNILEKYDLDPHKPFVILTYHPVTLEFKIPEENQLENIFVSLKKFNIQVLITSPGIEVGSNNLISKIKSKMKKYLDSKSAYVESLGHVALYNLIPKSSFIIGNSSFGIIEAPYFKIPTINIGDRQKGRLLHKSIISADYNKKSICKSIEKALDTKFKNDIKNMKYLFSNGNASDKIISIIKKTKVDQNFLQKQFLEN